MNHLCNIQSKTITQDSVTGEITETWSNTHTGVPCDIEALSVRDFIQSRADQSEIQVRIRIPYIAGIDSTMRLVGTCGCHSGKTYNPRGVLEDNITAQEYITLPCSQGVNEG